MDAYVYRLKKPASRMQQQSESVLVRSPWTLAFFIVPVVILLIMRLNINIFKMDRIFDEDDGWGYDGKPEGRTDREPQEGGGPEEEKQE